MLASDAVIFASIALGALVGDKGRWWTPNNFNLAVPKGNLELLTSFLLTQIYQEQCYGAGWQWEQSTRTFICFEHPVLHHTMILSGSCMWSVLPVVLTTCLTASMIAITLRHIFTFYPHLLFSGCIVAGYCLLNSGAWASHVERGLEFSTDTSSWNHPCSFGCPVLIQRVRGLWGIQIMN